MMNWIWIGMCSITHLSFQPKTLISGAIILQPFHPPDHSTYSELVLINTHAVHLLHTKTDTLPRANNFVKINSKTFCQTLLLITMIISVKFYENLNKTCCGLQHKWTTPTSACTASLVLTSHLYISGYILVCEKVFIKRQVEAKIFLAA